MKKLIIQALNEAKQKLDKRIPLIKKKTESISIRDISPLDIVEFMKDNNIPNDAYFDGNDNGDDGWDDILLSWEIDVQTTDKDKLKFSRDRFTSIAFKCVYDLLIKSGYYKRIGFSSRLLKEFDDTTVYDMYMSNDFDRLVKYYTLHFVKI